MRGGPGESASCGVPGRGGGRGESVPRPVQVSPRHRGLQKQRPPDSPGHPAPEHDRDVSHPVRENMAFTLRVFVISYKSSFIILIQISKFAKVC